MNTVSAKIDGNSPKNIIHFVKTNPPATLILFFICCMLIATLSLAINARHNTLLNTDILMDTYQLKTFINDLRVCIKPSNNEKVIKREARENDQIVISAAVPIEHLNSLKPNIKQVHGLISLEGFQWSCSNKTDAKYLEIGFNLSDKLDQNRICAQFSGKRKILEYFFATPCVSHFEYQPSTAVLQTKEKNGLGNFCTNGTKVNFEFDRKENTRDFSIYLTKEKNEQVCQTLLLCSFVLGMIILIAFVIVTFFYNSEPVDNDFYF